MKADYKIQEIYSMSLDDISFMNEALDTEDLEEEEEITTLDKAFPFLFT
ncbi:hypothetical protein [Enterococcus rotai]